jgi:phosphoglucosamine mutase
MFEPLPQLLKNVRVSAEVDWETVSVKKAIAAGEAKLQDTGRILIRKSGTEPLVRVMAEGEDAALISHIVDDIAGEIERAAAQ